VKETSKLVGESLCNTPHPLMAAVQAVNAIVECPDLRKDQILLMMCILAYHVGGYTDSQ
jgi:hypothetical protein